VEPGAFLPSKERKASEERRRKSYLVPTEAYSYQTLTPGATAKHLKAFPVAVDPRKEHKGADCRHEGEEFISVLDGNVEMMVGEERNVFGHS
jgi:electron transfer flavoprotein alpha subunit